MPESMPPFQNINAQKVFSIISSLIGLLLMFFTIPFLIQYGGFVIVGSIIGLVLFFLGLIYFLHAFFSE